jgi:hypothetical protein
MSLPLGDTPTETAGQKTLRDTPVMLKLRRKVAVFLVTFFAVTQRIKSDWHVGPPQLFPIKSPQRVGFYPPKASY